MFAYHCKSLTVLADSDVTVRLTNYYNAAAPVRRPVDVFYDNYVTLACVEVPCGEVHAGFLVRILELLCKGMHPPVWVSCRFPEVHQSPWSIQGISSKEILSTSGFAVLNCVVSLSGIYLIDYYIGCNACRNSLWSVLSDVKNQARVRGFRRSRFQGTGLERFPGYGILL